MDGPADARWRQRFRRRLLAWFDRQARDLPWRHDRTPYRVWISEIMLQQTQVTTVVGYYLRFIERFPNVHSLARADIQEVLHSWEGLGYYRRARQLHAAAQMVVAEYGGQFPTRIEQVRALPGIGRYTAGAILSIALDQQHPVLEANTVRLYCRLLAWQSDPTRTESQTRLWAFAEQVLPRRRVGDFNQALMELGSVICKPRDPVCNECPLRPLCPTFAGGLQDVIPRRRGKTPGIAVREAAVVIRRGGHILLRQCREGERWAGLWDVPRFPVSAADAPRLERELVAAVARDTGLAITLTRQIARLKHAVTRYRITLTCHEAVRCSGHLTGSQWHWIPADQLADYPLNTTARKLSRMLGTP